jgi:hypothetical protein
MANNSPLRHLMPPAVAVLPFLGFWFLNGGDWAAVRHPVVVALTVALAAACWFLFRPRAPNAKHDERSRSQAWSAIVPVVALLAGPVVASLFWALDVYVFDRQSYATADTRIEMLPQFLNIGIIPGIVGCLIVVALLKRK